MRTQTIILSNPLKSMTIVKKKPIGSVELKGFETRSVKVFKKGNRRYVMAKKGFILKH